MRGWEKIRVNCVTGEGGFQHLAACRKIWNPESGKFLLVKSGILGCKIGNSVHFLKLFDIQVEWEAVTVKPGQVFPSLTN